MPFMKQFSGTEHILCESVNSLFSSMSGMLGRSPSFSWVDLQQCLPLFYWALPFLCELQLPSLIFCFSSFLSTGSCCRRPCFLPPAPWLKKLSQCLTSLSLRHYITSTKYMHVTRRVMAKDSTFVPTSPPHSGKIMFSLVDVVEELGTWIGLDCDMYWCWLEYRSKSLIDVIITKILG